MTDTREALFALVDATLRPFQVDPKRGPSDAVGAITDAILGKFDVTPRGEGEQLFERDDSCGYCSRVHSDFAACFEDAPVVLDSPHGMGCPPGCGHDRSEAAVPDSEDVRAYRIETERGKGTAIQIGGSRAGKTQALAERVADEVTKRGGSATVTSLPPVEDVRDEIAGHPIGSGYYSTTVGVDEATEMARAVLALLPGRTEAEVKAEALREAAPGCNCEDDYAWLNDRADRIEKGEGRG